MAKLTRLDFRELPALYVVGKAERYPMDAIMQNDNNPLPAQWEKCFADGTFDTLNKYTDALFSPDYIGAMMDWDRGDGAFTSVIGVLMHTLPEPLPEGFTAHPIAPSTLAIGWIRGKYTADVCGVAHQETEKALREAGYADDGMTWCMEVYNYPRFTTPDEHGEITLDYYIPCHKKA